MTKMVRYLAPLASFWFAGSSAFADAPKLWIENPGGFSPDYLTNGKQEVSSGFFGTLDARDLVADNPQALALAQHASTFNTDAHLSYWLGVIPSAGLLGYGLAVNNTTIEIVTAFTFFGSALLTGYFVSESKHYTYEAINTYNGVSRHHDTEQADKKVTFSLGAMPSGAFAGIRYGL